MKEHSLYNNDIWDISGYRNSNTGELRLKVTFPNGMNTEFPIPGIHNCAVYDFPERIPAYIKKEVNRLYGFTKTRGGAAVLTDINGII